MSWTAGRCWPLRDEKWDDHRPDEWQGLQDPLGSPVQTNLPGARDHFCQALISLPRATSHCAVWKACRSLNACVCVPLQAPWDHKRGPGAAPVALSFVSFNHLTPSSFSLAIFIPPPSNTPQRRTTPPLLRVTTLFSPTLAQISQSRSHSFGPRSHATPTLFGLIAQHRPRRPPHLNRLL